MNKLIIILVFIYMNNFMFSQNEETIITGTVYISSSISNGAIGYAPTSQGPFLFRNQNIYFIKDSITVKAKTDSLGLFSAALKAGEYTVYQEGGRNANRPGLQQFGTYVIMVQKGSGPFKIEFHNSSNRRSAMNGAAKGLPGSNATKNSKRVTEKK